MPVCRLHCFYDQHFHNFCQGGYFSPALVCLLTAAQEEEQLDFDQDRIPDAGIFFEGPLNVARQGKNQQVCLLDNG